MALLHFMMAKRDKLESGAALPEGCAVGVSLRCVSFCLLRVVLLFLFIFRCFGDGILLK